VLEREPDQIRGESRLPWIFRLGITEAVSGNEHREKGRSGELDYSHPEGGARVSLA
jgi:hypothetical protein